MREWRTRLVRRHGGVPRDARLVPPARRQLRLRRVVLVLPLVRQLTRIPGVSCARWERT